MFYAAGCSCLLWGLLWFIIGSATTFFLIGWGIIGITILWGIYRVGRGLLALLANEPMPRPG